MKGPGAIPGEPLGFRSDPWAASLTRILLCACQACKSCSEGSDGFRTCRDHSLTGVEIATDVRSGPPALSPSRYPSLAHMSRPQLQHRQMS